MALPPLTVAPRTLRHPSALKADAAIVLLLLLLGCFQAATVLRVESFGSDSSMYMELAHNIRAAGRYEFNYTPHTLYPPGFPLLLAGISILAGESYDIFIRFMPVFSSLALIVWYFILKRHGGRFAAGAACLLVATSAPLFAIVTQAVRSDPPFFLMSGVVLLCLVGLESPDLRRPARFLLLACLCVATVATVLLRSAGIALCAALLAWAGIALWRRASHPPVLVRGAVLAALAGSLAFLGWIAWARHSEHREYQGQHMKSYASQFLARDPHRPELGTASALDVAVRIASNVPVQSAHIAAVLARLGYVMPAWYSPLPVLTLALLLAGLVSYIFDTRTTLFGWYFLAYFTVTLCWPFDEGPRFVLPVLPLAFVLIWRGAVVAVRLLHARPAATLAWISGCAAVLAVATALTARLPGLQARAAVAFWPLLTAVSVLLLFLVRRAGPARATHAVNAALCTLSRWHIHQVVVAALLAAGVFQQAVIAGANRNPDPALFTHHASADCSSWLRTAGGGVVMAQQAAIIHRLTGRRVVNFPITSDPWLIAATVKRENVRYLVVNDPLRYEYFWPTEQERWLQIGRAYPGMFRLAHTGPGYRIFELTQ